MKGAFHYIPNFGLNFQTDNSRVEQHFSEFPDFGMLKFCRVSPRGFPFHFILLAAFSNFLVECRFAFQKFKNFGNFQRLW